MAIKQMMQLVNNSVNVSNFHRTLKLLWIWIWIISWISPDTVAPSPSTQNVASLVNGTIEEGCVWRSAISPTMPLIQEARPRSSCSKGEVRWYDPQGQLDVHFRHETSGNEFKICIVATSPGNIGSIYTVPRGGDKIYIPFHTSNSENSCVNSVNGQLDITIMSSLRKSHLNVIRYLLQPP